jgi:N-methylhydantoinase A
LTDAALIAGLLPDRLGGDVALDRASAMRAVTTDLGIGASDAPSTAFGAVKVAEAMIAEAVRRKAFSRGIDPRNAVLVAAGGGGALHAAEVADRVGCRMVIVPRAAGVLAASGLTQVGFCEESERPIEMPLSQDAVDRLAKLAAEEAASLRKTMMQWSRNTDAAAVRHEVDISYQGQGHSLAVPYDPAADDAAILAARFDVLHERVRGHAFVTSRRVLALRSIATRPVDSTDDGIPASASSRESGTPASGHRLVAADPRIECPVFARGSLPAGAQLTGPALIDAPDTTIWLPPDWTCVVAPDQTLLLTAVEQTP